MMSGCLCRAAAETRASCLLLGTGLGCSEAGGGGQGVSFRRVATVGSCQKSGISADISVTQRDVMEFS